MVRNDDNDDDTEDIEDGSDDEAGVAQKSNSPTKTAETLPPINKRNSLRRFFSLIVVVSSL